MSCKLGENRHKEILNYTLKVKIQLKVTGYSTAAF